MRICRPSMLEKARGGVPREWMQVNAGEHREAPCSQCQQAAPYPSKVSLAHRLAQHGSTFTAGTPKRPDDDLVVVERVVDMASQLPDIEPAEARNAASGVGSAGPG